MATHAAASSGVSARNGYSVVPHVIVNRVAASEPLSRVRTTLLIFDTLIACVRRAAETSPREKNAALGVKRGATPRARVLQLRPILGLVRREDVLAELEPPLHPFPARIHAPERALLRSHFDDVRRPEQIARPHRRHELFDDIHRYEPRDAARVGGAGGGAGQERGQQSLRAYAACGNSRVQNPHTGRPRRAAAAAALRRPAKPPREPRDSCYTKARWENQGGGRDTCVFFAPRSSRPRRRCFWRARGCPGAAFVLSREVCDGGRHARCARALGGSSRVGT